MSASLPGYAQAADRLAAAYEQIDPSDLYWHVAEIAPRPGETVIDVGAGTGRDAAYWSGMGCHVVAVEPVAELWRHPEVPRFCDRLPHLHNLRPFDGL